jgi:hypothetical protein
MFWMVKTNNNMSKNTNLSFLTDYITADITNGRIGINNASPTVAFDVTGAGRFSDGTQGLTIRAYTAGAGWGAIYPVGVTPSASNYVFISKGTDTNLNASTQIALAIADSGKLVVTSTAVYTTVNVGIGTNAPSAISTYTTLDIRGGTGGGLRMGVSGSSTPFNLQQAGTDAYLNNVANGAMLLYTNDTERMRITSGGNVLIGGTSSDGYGFQVYAATSLNGQVKFTQVAASSGFANETVAVNGSSASYFLNKDTGTSNGSSTTTFNIGGLSNAAGTIAHITLRVSKAATASAINTVAYVQINSVDMTGEVFVTGTGASTVIKTFTVVYNTTTGWQKIGAIGTY